MALAHGLVPRLEGVSGSPGEPEVGSCVYLDAPDRLWPVRLAPEAYTAIGMAFAMLLLAALGVTVAGRLSSVEGAEHQLVTPTR